MSAEIPYPTLRLATRVWFRIACLSFGGPAGQIALMHRELVEERRWIGEADFLHALNACMLLPGPEAQQLATYAGWRLHGVRGGIVAGGLFILPGALAILIVSLLYATIGNLPLVEALFLGLRAAVIALVAQALLRMGGRLLGNRWRVALAVLAFLALFLFAIPFPAVVAAAALLGWLVTRAGGTAFLGGGHGGDAADSGPVLVLPPPDGPGALRAGLAFLGLWGAVLGLSHLFAPAVFADIARFFSQMAVVTFGGAYAVLVWVAQAAVERFGWLSPQEMIDGLALAETTPGPLILVLEFVGFLAAWRAPAGLPPALAGILGALLTLAVTFLPCFAWIFLGAPHAERLRQNLALSGALAAVTAAVVGVVANLALWFALHALFAAYRKVSGLALELPVFDSLNLPALLLTVAALVATFRFKVGLLPLLGGAALSGLALGLAGLG
jgi:chromate transporter